MPEQSPKNDNPPLHVAMILDGNGRWAKAQDQPPIFGHKAGFKVVENVIIPTLNDSEVPKISELSLYIFSTENWGRSEAEVKALMELIRTQIKRLLPKLMEKNIRVHHAGRRTILAEKYPTVLKAIDNVTEKTQNNTGSVLNLAIDYGSEEEVRQASSKQAEFGGPLESHFYVRTKVDIMIRTGGDKRLSNFLMNQSNYAELFFLIKKLPELTEEDLLEVLKEYMESRPRTYGVRPKVT